MPFFPNGHIVQDILDQGQHEGATDDKTHSSDSNRVISHGSGHFWDPQIING